VSYEAKTGVDPYAGSPNVARCKEKTKERRKERKIRTSDSDTIQEYFYQLNNTCALCRWEHVDLIWCHGYYAHDHGLIFQPVGIYNIGEIEFTAPFAHQGLTPMHLEACLHPWRIAAARHIRRSARPLHNHNFVATLARAH
jgi:hypothetical protein